MAQIGQPSRPVDPEVIEEENSMVPVMGSTAIEAVTKAEIDIQIKTAKTYPRSIQKFRQDAVSLATLDPEVAATCGYKLKRKNADGSVKIIEGPSVRLAEIISASYGNLRVLSRIVEINEKEVVAQGLAVDLEKNVAYSSEVRRRITGRDGRRYGDDMIILTCNAACAIADRNAVYKVVPRSLVNQVLNAAKKVAVGDAASLADRRKKLLAYWKEQGVTEAQVLNYLGVKGAEDITLSHIEDLLGLMTAIGDGITTIKEAFGEAPPQTTTKGKASKPKTLEQAAAAVSEKAAAEQQKKDDPQPPPEEGEGGLFPDK